MDLTALRHTIAAMNMKGGVGKTSIVANVSGMLAQAGYRVLAVDLDPQGNLGDDLGYEAAGLSDAGESLFQSVSAGVPLRLISGVRTNLDVVPGGSRLFPLTDFLYASQRRRDAVQAPLARALAPIANDYDVTFIDCPPENEMLQEEALRAARWLLMPSRTDASSRRGMRGVAERFAHARGTNPDLAVLGVVLFGVTTGARRVREQARAMLEEDLGGAAPVFASSVRYVEAAAHDARARGQLAHELERFVAEGPAWYERLRDGTGNAEVVAASAGSLAGDYHALAAEILEALATHEREAEMA